MFPEYLLNCCGRVGVKDHVSYCLFPLVQTCVFSHGCGEVLAVCGGDSFAEAWWLCCQIVKQSQQILNFLAQDSRLTNEHIDCIWAASQVSPVITLTYQSLSCHNIDLSKSVLS